MLNLLDFLTKLPKSRRLLAWVARAVAALSPLLIHKISRLRPTLWAIAGGAACLTPLTYVQAVLQWRPRQGHSPRCYHADALQGVNLVRDFPGAVYVAVLGSRQPWACWNPPAPASVRRGASAPRQVVPSRRRFMRDGVAAQWPAAGLAGNSLVRRMNAAQRCGRAADATGRWKKIVAYGALFLRVGCNRR